MLTFTIILFLLWSERKKHVVKFQYCFYALITQSYILFIDYFFPLHMMFCLPCVNYVWSWWWNDDRKHKTLFKAHLFPTFPKTGHMWFFVSLTIQNVMVWYNLLENMGTEWCQLKIKTGFYFRFITFVVLSWCLKWKFVTSMVFM